MHQDGTQRLGIERVRGASSHGQPLELLRGLPQRAILEEEPRRQGLLRDHRPARVDIEEGGAQPGARGLSLVEAGAGGNEGELPAEIAEARTRQTFEEGLAGDARSALVGDEQMKGPAEFVLEGLVPRHLDVVGAEARPCHGLAPSDVRGTEAWGEGGLGMSWFARHGWRGKGDHPARAAAWRRGSRSRDLVKVSQ